MSPLATSLLASSFRCSAVFSLSAIPSVQNKGNQTINIIESIRCQRSDDIPVTWPPTLQFASGFAAGGSFLLGLSAGRTTGCLRLDIVFGGLFLRGAGTARSLKYDRIHDK